MNTCKDCRFWIESQGSIELTERECRHGALHNVWDWPFDTEIASGVGDSSGIRTGKDFGCIHWTAKPLPSAQ